MLITGASEGFREVAQVRVFKFTVFDFTGRHDVPSSRYARLDTISIIGGQPIRGSELLVDEQELDGMGMTKGGFKARDQ